MLSVGELVKLSDGTEFIVAGNAKVNEKNYYFLIDSKNLKEVKYCIEKNLNGKIYMKEFDNEDAIKKLSPFFLKSAKDYLDTLPNN